MRWISGIAIKREDIDFHLNTSVPLSPLPLARTCRLSIKRRILPGLWCLDARLIKFVDPLHGQILRDMVKLWIDEEETKGWCKCERRMRRGEGWWEGKEGGEEDYGRWLCFTDKGSLIDGGFFEVFFLAFFFFYFSGQSLFENFSVLRFERLRVIWRATCSKLLWIIYLLLDYFFIRWNSTSSHERNLKIWNYKINFNLVNKDYVIIIDGRI